MAAATTERRKNGNAINGVFLAAVHQAKMDIIIPKIPPNKHSYSAIALPSADRTLEYFPEVNFLSSDLKVTIETTRSPTDSRNRMKAMNFRHPPLHLLQRFDQHLHILNIFILL